MSQDRNSLIARETKCDVCEEDLEINLNGKKKCLTVRMYLNECQLHYIS